MPDDLAHGVRHDAIVQRVSDVGVAEVMELHRWQASGPEHIREVARRHGARVEVLAVTLEHEIPVAHERLALITGCPTQGLYCNVRQPDCAPRPICLRGETSQTVVLIAIDGGVHLQGALIEVDVLPPDGTDLPAPHASGHREHVQGFEMRLDRRSSEKSPGIGPVKNYPVTPGDGWPQHSRAAGVA